MSFDRSNMIDPRLLSTLARICRALDDANLNWAVTGSLGFALHGIKTPVADIDLQTDKTGAYEIEKRFQQQITQRVRFSESASIRSHFGVLEINGVKVEIMGDLQKRLPDGTWEPPVDVREHREFIDLRGIQVPVLSVEYEAQAYETLGRSGKADQLRRWLKSQKKRRSGE